MEENMIGEYKTFDSKLYNIHDNVKKNILDYFAQKGVKATINEDKYGPDLIVVIDSQEYYCEVQQKMAWKGDNFPYKELNIEERKEKFLKLDKPIFFCVVNAEKTHALFTSGKIVSGCPKKSVSNKNISHGELFFRVPIEKTRKVKIT